MVGPGAKRAFAAASLKTSTGTTTTSNGVPELTRVMMLGVESKWLTSLWPVAFSNAGAIAFIDAVIEPPAITLSSAACSDEAAMARIPDIKLVTVNSGFLMTPSGGSRFRLIRNRDVGDKGRFAHRLSRERRALFEPG